MGWTVAANYLEIVEATTTSDQRYTRFPSLQSAGVSL